MEEYLYFSAVKVSKYTLSLQPDTAQGPGERVNSTCPDILYLLQSALQ